VVAFPCGIANRTALSLAALLGLSPASGSPEFAVTVAGAAHLPPPSLPLLNLDHTEAISSDSRLTGSVG
jgi:hypothetical protein